jgi:succinate-acetate transporter protein
MSLAILFFMLAAARGIPSLLPIAGIEGVFCGFSAFYLSLAEVLNEAHNRTVLPIGQVKAT